MNTESIIIILGIIPCIILLLSIGEKKKNEQYDIKNIHGIFYVYEDNVIIAVCKTEEEADNVIINRYKQKKE